MKKHTSAARRTNKPLTKIQDNELLSTRDEAEELLDKYTNLYDFAPVGYFTLGPDGVIRLVNLTGALLAGVERSKLIGRPFGHLVVQDQRADFEDFLRKVFENQDKQSGDFNLVGDETIPRTVNFKAQRSPAGLECSVVLMDVTGRRKAEDQLRVSEIRYRRLFETAHDGVLLLDPATGWITDANPFMTRLLGYPRDVLVGKQLFEIGLVKDAAASREMFRQLKRDHEVRYENLPLESRDGLRQEVEVVANLYQENGRPVIQCNIRDITERKRTEATLKRLAAIVESSDDAIIGKDLNGIVTDWNMGAEHVFGYSAAEMIGTSITRLIPRDRMAEEDHILEKIRHGESVEHFETLRQTKDGRLIEISITASPIKDFSGRVIGVSKVARDITGRKKAEEVLRRNESLFSLLVAQAPVGVFVVDSEFRLQQVNPAAMPAFRNIEPLIGRDFSEIHHLLWPKRLSDKVVASFRHTLRTGEPYHAPEFSGQRRDDGSKEYYEWQIQRITLPDGTCGVVAFFNDITERRRAEQAQRRLDFLTASNLRLKREIARRKVVEKALQKTESRQSSLLEQSVRQQKHLRSLSHQILHAQEEERKRISRELHDVIAQTLVGINMHLVALTQGTSADSATLHQEIESTHQLVDDAVEIVHQFARELRPPALDDFGLIPAIETFTRRFIADTGIRVDIKASAGVEQLSGTLRTVLYRVAQEALTNVARHAKASRVEVNLLCLPGITRMEITDNGQGFDVDGATEEGKINRLGLLGMRERVEMVGGMFCVESASGSHTTVRVEFAQTEERTRKRTAGKIRKTTPPEDS